MSSLEGLLEPRSRLLERRSAAVIDVLTTWVHADPGQLTSPFVLAVSTFRLSRMIGEPEKPVTYNDTADIDLTDALGRAKPLTQVGQILPFVALSGTAEGELLTVDAAGVLRLWTQDLKLRGEGQLWRPAYRILLDSAAGRMYAASSQSEALTVTPLGERELAVGNLHAYDIKALLRDGGKVTGELRRLHSVELNAQITGMWLSGSELHVLGEGQRPSGQGDLTTDTFLARIPTDFQPPIQRSSLGGGMSWFTRSNDGKLYAMVGGRLRRIDPKGLNVEDILSLPGVTNGIAVINDTLIVMERRQGVSLLLVNMTERNVVARVTLPIPGRSVLEGTSGGELFVGTSAVLDGQLVALKVTDASKGWLSVRARAMRDSKRLLRGEMHLTPDGKLLLTGNGYVFAAP